MTTTTESNTGNENNKRNVRRYAVSRPYTGAKNIRR